MSDQENPDLVFKEVDEEMRTERMNALWKAYGKYLISLLVGIILVVAGREGYNEYKRTTEEAHSTAYVTAVTEATDNPAEAITIWTQAKDTMGSSYGALARFNLVAVYLDELKFDEAIDEYRALSKDKNIESRFRELATLNLALLVLDKKGDKDQARSLLASIASNGKPWFYSATEQLAILDLADGDYESALLKFALLESDPSTPQSMIKRASQFRGLIEAKGQGKEITEGSANESETKDGAEQ